MLNSLFGHLLQLLSTNTNHHRICSLQAELSLSWLLGLFLVLLVILRVGVGVVWNLGLMDLLGLCFQVDALGCWGEDHVVVFVLL